MHEGAVCREIVDIVTLSALENDIHKIYEITISVGQYSCIHEGQLNFYFDIIKKGTIMEDARIIVEKNDDLMAPSKMYVKTYKGE